MPEETDIEKTPPLDSPEKVAEVLNEDTNSSKKPIKALRTYRGDIEEIFSREKTSASSIVVAEQQRKDVPLLDPEKETKEKLKNKYYITIGSGLLLFGIIIVGSFYYLRTGEKASIERETKTLISFSTEKLLPLASSTKSQLVNAISAEKKSFKLPVNSVLYINVTNEDGVSGNVESIIGLLSPRIPQSLLRALENEYMLGIYSFDTNEPFIILTTDDFPASYSGMLKWENGMVSDIGELFGITQNSDTGTLVFEDEEFKNKDLRIVRDNNRKTILLYSFVDKNTIVIAKNENIFAAILGKYLISKMAR